jgi:hypothetical protein
MQVIRITSSTSSGQMMQLVLEIDAEMHDELRQYRAIITNGEGFSLFGDPDADEPWKKGEDKKPPIPNGINIRHTYGEIWLNTFHIEMIEFFHDGMVPKSCRDTIEQQRMNLG